MRRWVVLIGLSVLWGLVVAVSTDHMFWSTVLLLGGGIAIAWILDEVDPL